MGVELGRELTIVHLLGVWGPCGLRKRKPEIPAEMSASKPQ